MPHSCFIEISDAEKQQLLDIADQSIKNGLENHCPVVVSDEDLVGILAEPLGCFVTLTKNAELRGCIGCLETSQPLALSVATNAFNAAFHDPRFPELRRDELDLIQLEISILSEMIPMQVESRQALLAQIEPHRDGLLIEDGRHRATFLPQVWEKLPEPEDFLSNLMLKAGLPASHWSKTIKVCRYGTVSIQRSDEELR